MKNGNSVYPIKYLVGNVWRNDGNYFDKKLNVIIPGDRVIIDFEIEDLIEYNEKVKV